MDERVERLFFGIYETAEYSMSTSPVKNPQLCRLEHFEVRNKRNSGIRRYDRRPEAQKHKCRDIIPLIRPAGYLWLCSLRTSFGLQRKNIYGVLQIQA
jgi:hypothetical protein